MASTMFQHPPDKGFLRIVGGSIALHIVVILAGLILINYTPKREFLTPVYSVSLVAPKHRTVRKRAAKRVTVKKAAPKPAPIKKKSVKPVPVRKEAVKSVKIKSDTVAKKKKIEEQKARTVTNAVERLKKKIERREEQALVASKITELSAREKAQESAIKERLAVIKSGLLFIDERKKEDTTDTAPAPVQSATSSEATGIEANIYLAMLKDQVQNEWSYQEVLRDKNLSVIVAIKIDRDGRLIKLKVEKSSGNPRFDNSLLRAVKKAAPFSPLPDGIKGRYLETGLRFCPTCK